MGKLLAVAEAVKLWSGIPQERRKEHLFLFLYLASTPDYGYNIAINTNAFKKTLPSSLTEANKVSALLKKMNEKGIIKIKEKKPAKGKGNKRIIYEINPSSSISKEIVNELVDSITSYKAYSAFTNLREIKKLISKQIEDIRIFDSTSADFLEEVVKYSPTVIKAMLLDIKVLVDAYYYNKIRAYFHEKYQIENDPMFDAIIGCVVIDYILNPGMRERIDSLISPPKVSEEEKEEFLKKLRVSKTKILGSS